MPGPTPMTHRPSTRRRLVWLPRVVAVFLLLIGVTACDQALELVAGDEEGGTQEAGATDEPAEQPAEAAEPLEEAATPEAAEAAESAGASPAEGNERVLPDEFPAAFPLPEDYMLVRMDVGEYEEVGLSMAFNIATDGTVEEWAAFYEDALQENFEDVRVRDDIQDDPWHFHGHGFERASLYVSGNLGVPDMDGNDSSHLPVMLTISFEERAPD